MNRLGIVVSHPIQYYSPLFQFLARQLELTVFYGYLPTPEQTGASGFNVPVTWGRPLLSDHNHVVVGESVAGTVDGPRIGHALEAAGLTHVLILGWQYRLYWRAFSWCIRRRIPVSVRGDSQINPEESQWKSIARASVYPLFLRRYSRIFYVGHRNREYLLRNGAREEQLFFAPHAVDQDFWQAAGPPTSRIDKIRFIWVGKFIEKKRPLDAIAAFSRAISADPELELLMVGTGPMHRAASAAAGRVRGVTLAGFKNQVELRDCYTSSHCLLLTSGSATETWGLVVNEAMAVGLPAIVTTVSGCSADMITNGESGFTFNAGDVGALAARILQVAQSIRSDPLAFRRRIEQLNRIYSYESNEIAIMSFLEGT